MLNVWEVNMGWFGGKETPVPEQVEETKDAGTDINKALNDPGFTEFLSKYPNRIELSDENAEEVNARYERYKQVGSTIKEVQSILAKEFSTEVSTDALKISINPSEIDGARGYLEDLAVNNEGEFDKILETIKEYHATSEEADKMIAEVQTRLKAHEQKSATLDKVNDIHWIKRWSGLGFNEREQQAISDAKKLRMGTRMTNVEADKLNEEGDSVLAKAEVELTGKLEDYDRVRMELMLSLGENTGALKLAKDKLAGKLNESMGTTLADVDKASSAYNQIEGELSDQDLTFDYLGSNPDFNKIDYVKKLNEEAESRATEAIKNAVVVSPVMNGQLSRLESTLDPYLKRESLGTKTQDETKEFVLGVVHELFAEYAKAYQEPDKRNKSWLLQRILEKNGVKANENFKSKKTLEEEKRSQEEAEEKRQTAEAVANPDDWEDHTSESERDEAEAPEEVSDQSGSDKELTENIYGEGQAIPNSPDVVDDAPHPADEQDLSKTVNPARPDSQQEQFGAPAQQTELSKPLENSTFTSPAEAIQTSDKAVQEDIANQGYRERDLKNIPLEQRSKPGEPMTGAEFNASVDALGRDNARDKENKMAPDAIDG